MNNTLCCTALLLALPAITRAHAMLDHALPAVGSTVATAPTELKLWLDQTVDPAKSTVEVVDASGKSVVSGAIHSDASDDTVLIVPLSKTAGKVKVTWSAFCPPCGHTTHGSFQFTVGE